MSNRMFQPVMNKKLVVNNILLTKLLLEEALPQFKLPFYGFMIVILNADIIIELLK